MSRIGVSNGKPRILPALGLAGILGPAIFATAALAQSLLRSDHNLIEDPVSALAAGSSGWVQSVNFAFFGLLLVAFTLGLHLGVHQTRWSSVGPAFLLVSAAGLLGAALFPATDASGNFRDDRVPHIISAVAAFLGAGVGFVGLSRRMRLDEKWRGLAQYAFVSGAAIIVLFVGAGLLVRPDEAPFHELLGLSQWLLLAIWLPCMVALASRLLDFNLRHSQKHDRGVS